MRVLIALAGAVVVSFGMHAIGSILSPALLALVLTICAQPVRGWLTGHGTPAAVSTLAAGLTTFALLAAFVGLLIVALAQFVAMVPLYEAEIQQLGQQVGALLQNVGLEPEDGGRALTAVADPSQYLNFFTGLLGGAFGLVALGVVVLTMLILMPADAVFAPTLLSQLEPAKPDFVHAMSTFVHSVRRYMVVTTALGLLQGALNGVALWLLGIPAALLWAILAFLCSFIPNVGYFLALVPPLVFGYLTGGWGTVVAIIVIYAVINAVVQSIIQPRVVGNAVALSQTLTFFSVLFWAVVLGPIGAILAVPLTLLVRAVLIDADPRAHIWRAAIGDLTDTKRLLQQEAAARKAARPRRKTYNGGEREQS
ncbi:AI-2E family transporter [Arthrobacter pigmenti]